MWKAGTKVAFRNSPAIATARSLCPGFALAFPHRDRLNALFALCDTGLGTARPRASLEIRRFHLLAPAPLAGSKLTLLSSLEQHAGMAELADAADSKSADPCGHGGSTPPPGTNKAERLDGIGLSKIGEAKIVGWLF
jgi:hypothetical protein